MADNPQVRAGTAGGTITVAADEVTIYGSVAQLQGMKIHDGLEGGTIGARVTSTGELVVNQQNNGTVSVTGTPNVHVTNAATVAVTGTPNVHVTNSGTVIQGTDPWRTHQTNSATVSVSAISGTVPTLEQGGTVIAHVSNSGTVIQGTNPWIVTANGGTILGQRGTVTALQGTDPWLVNAWLTAAATATLTGTNPVFVTNNGTINGGTLLGQQGTVIAHVSNNGTVAVSSIAAGDNNIGNVDVLSVIPGTGATNLGKAEDDAHTTGDVGVMGLAVRKNEAASVASEGDYVPLIADSSGALWTHANDGTVAIKGNVVVGNNGTVSITGTPNVHLTNSSTVIQGTNPWIVTANGGTILGQDGTVAVRGNVWVGNNGTVSVSSIAAGDNNIGNVDVVTLPGGITGFAEDAGHTTGDVGIQALGVRKNEAAALAGADADYTPLISDSAGALWTHVNDGTVAVKGNVLVGNNGTVTLTGTNPVFVNNNGTVSVSAVVPGTGATNLGKAEDAAHNSGDTGVMALAVRNDAGTAFAADGDYVPLSIDSAGAVRVTGGGGGTQYTEGDTDTSITGTAALAEGPSDTLTPLQVDASKHLQVDIAADSVGIGGGVQYVEDEAHASGGTGVMSLAVRKNEAAALAGTDGDYIPFITDSNGALWTHANDGTVALKGNVWVGNNGTVSVSAIAAGDNNIGNVDVVTLPGGITGFAEDAGHTTGDVGIQSLGVRKNVAAALAGADADYTPLISDSVGALWTHVNDGTVAIMGNVLVGNNGTVSVSALPGGITGFAEDAGHTTGDVGIQSLAVRKNVAAALAGADADYTPLISDDVGAAWVHVNDGTIAIKGNIHVGNNGTVTLTGTNPVFVTNNGTVNGGTLLGHMGTVHAHLNNLGTVTLSGTNPTFQTNNGTVSVSSIAAGDNNIGNVDIVTLPGGITGFAEDAGHTTGDVGIPAMAVRKNEPAALAGSDADYTPLTSDAVGAAWTHVNDGTIAIKGNVLVGNNGTVSITGTPNVHITNAATVTATNLDIRDLTYVSDSITKGSATIGLGYTLGGTNINLTQSGTVIPSVSSRALYVVHEAFSVQGGTLTVTARNGNGGGTLWGPMQFSPTGGMAVSLGIEDGGLYETASGSAVYYEIAGSGTIGGRIRWARLAS